MYRLALVMLLGVLGTASCAPPDQADAEMGPVVLGPADGHDLPPLDLQRVSLGDLAPDFTAASLAGPAVTLSSFRGVKNVVLVFYRGHW